jgi:hypothetical protein
MWLSKRFTRIISTGNVVGREQKTYKILRMEIRVFSILDKKDPNKVDIGG